MSEEEKQPQEEEQPQAEEQSQEPSQSEGEKSSWYEKPGSMGDSAGEWVQSKLNPVGKYAGQGLETAAKPLGGVVDPLLGGVMRTGEAFGEQAGVGFGNKEGGPAKQGEAEAKKMQEPIGGKEQTADNPLGLNQSS